MFSEGFEYRYFFFDTIFIGNSIFYRKKGVSVDGSTQFWACTLKTCNGRAHSPVDTEELVVGQHNHGAVFSSHEVIILHLTNLCSTQSLFLI